MPPNPSPSTGVTSSQSQLEEIWRSESLLDAMCGPGKFETHIAVTLARQMMALYQGFDTRLVQVQDLPQVVRVLRSSGLDRHLVLLHRSGALSDAVLDSVESLALKLNCIVDVISFGKTENKRLRKIARQTDGAFLTAPEGPTSAEWMVRAYASLGHRYEVTYPLAAAADSASEFKIIPPPKMGLVVPRPSPQEMPAA